MLDGYVRRTSENGVGTMIINLPNRLWYKTRVVDGVQLWSSREWRTGEKQARIAEIILWLGGE